MYVTNLRKYFIFIQDTVKPHSPLSQVFPKDDCLPSRLKLHFQVGFKRTAEINNGDTKYVNVHTFASIVKHLLLKNNYNKGTLQSDTQYNPKLYWIKTVLSFSHLFLIHIKTWMKHNGFDSQFSFCLNVTE